MENIAVVTISDTCASDPSKDTSGPTLALLIKEHYPDASLLHTILPDDQNKITQEFIHLADNIKVDLILTTGGTGFSKRDITPEATKAVIHKEVPAIPTALTVESLKVTPMAMVSRAVSGIRNNTLIINLPGSRKAVMECFAIIKPMLTHAISLIKDNVSEVKQTHDKLQSHDNVKSQDCPHSNIDVSKVAFRPRESPYPMIEMLEAYRLVDELILKMKTEVESVDLEKGLGRVIAEQVVALEPLPPFPASVKDGYACVSSDGTGVRKVRAAVIAGEASVTPLSRGECMRINTGAAVPMGADCVVQVEDTMLVSASDDGKTEYAVEIMVEPKLNQDIRPIGSDVPLGSILSYEGTILDSALIGVLAGAGVMKVLVKKQLQVALLSTGNELQEPNEPKLRPSHVRDSNRTMLGSLLREHGFTSIDCGIARDDPNELKSAISNALSKADILVCTGGVSMGEKDLLKPVLMKDFNATLHFGRVRMKPGKPCTFASCTFDGRSKFIFALPGNPVSAYVCCLLFVIRGLRGNLGRQPSWPTLKVALANDVTLDPRPEYARATLSWTDNIPVATLIGSQASSRLLSACGASVLLELPGADYENKILKAGTVVTALVTSKLDH